MYSSLSTPTTCSCMDAMLYPGPFWTFWVFLLLTAYKEVRVSFPELPGCSGVHWSTLDSLDGPGGACSHSGFSLSHRIGIFVFSMWIYYMHLSIHPVQSTCTPARFCSPSAEPLLQTLIQQMLTYYGTVVCSRGLHNSWPPLLQSAHSGGVTNGTWGRRRGGGAEVSHPSHWLTYVHWTTN